MNRKGMVAEVVRDHIGSGYSVPFIYPTSVIVMTGAAHKRFSMSANYSFSLF
jgi:hypothetical protein